MSDEASPEFSDELMVEALSRADGRNSTIRVYPDRIEWLQEQTISSTPRPKDQPPVIPMSMVISVKARKDGPIFSKLLLRTFTQRITFRMYSPQAVAVRNAITAMLDARPRELVVPAAVAAPPPPPPPPPPPAPPAPDPAEEKVQQLQSLLADGFITSEEFEAAKAQLGLT